MERAEAITRLKGFEQRFRSLGAVSLYLFGSTARDEATDASDLDLFLEIEPGHRFSALDLVAAKLMVEGDLHLPVDVATRDGLHPLLRDEIEAEAVRIF